MSDQKNQALNLLVPKRKFSRAEWLILITSRLDRLRPHLDHFTLEKMGERLFIPYADGVKLNELYAQKIPFDGLSKGMLNFQGLFFSTPRCDWIQWIEDKKRIEWSFWGLLRNGKFILVTLYYSILDKGKNSRSVGEITRVVIQDTDIETILSHYPETEHSITSYGPPNLWWQLGEQVKEFASKRDYLHQTAQKLQKQFELEDMLLDQIGAKEPGKKEEVCF